METSVHKVLAQSYLAFFVLATVGLCADALFPFRVIVPEHKIVAVAFFAAGPLLVAWSQYTSHLFEKRKVTYGEPQFRRGPYQFVRNPTQLGLLLLVTGYALATGAVFLFAATVLSYVISNVYFYQHERLLAQKYGEQYEAYKASVKKIL